MGPLSKKVLLQYIAAVAGYAAALMLTTVLGGFISQNLMPHMGETAYLFFSFLRNNFWAIFMAAALVGWVIITRHFITKPLRYLDEVTDASKLLASPKPEPIVLSKALSDTEHELNLARERALLDARAAKDAEQRKNDLIVYLAHDLKTPLTSVIGYLTLLRDEGQISDELRERYLGIALGKAERLEDLINEFFEITRFNLSDIELRYGRVNLTRMLEQLAFEMMPILSEKGLRCTVDAAPDIMISCDADKMQRVFDNLLRNAAFYSYDDSVVSVEASQSDSSTVIRFTNRCDTIPPERLGRVFEQFYRLDSSRRSGSGGAGLGLAIAREIVQHHGGTITAKSADDTVEFTVTLPLS